MVDAAFWIIGTAAIIWCMMDTPKPKPKPKPKRKTDDAIIMQAIEYIINSMN